MRSLQQTVMLVVTLTLPFPALAEPVRVTGEQRQYLEVGWRAYQDGHLSEALNAYERALSFTPNDPSILYDIGCLYALLRDAPQARAYWQQALQQQPQLAPALDGLGQLAERDGSIARARTLYRQARLADPANVKFLRHLIRADLQLQDADEARLALQQLLGYAPSDANARYTLGVLELRAGAPDLAIHEFQQVTRVAPKHVMAWNGLALALARTGAFDQAREALDTAKLLDPDNASTETNEGVLAARQEQWAQARAAWEHALVLAPDFAPAQHNLDTLQQRTVASQ